jgi:hypothetical protein
LLESEKIVTLQQHFGSLEDFERSYITKVLEHCSWKISGKNDIYNDPFKWTDIYKANKETISSWQRKYNAVLKEGQEEADLIYPDQEFTIPSKEGWGMTTDGTNLIMSDGTNNLYFLDPSTLSVVKTLPVSENGYAKDFLNELEYINGYIFANIWGTSKIAKIDIETGIVQGEINLRSLAEDAYYEYKGSLEMNGIAYDSITEVMYITGKMWPKVYKIKLD